MKGTKTKTISDFIEIVTCVVCYRDVCGVTGLVGIKGPDYPKGDEFQSESEEDKKNEVGMIDIDVTWYLRLDTRTLEFQQ